MGLRRAGIVDIFDLQKICMDAYAKNFFSHWDEGGLEWYLDKEFSTARLKADLTDRYTDYYFINHEQNNVGFIKIFNTPTADLTFENSVELEKIYVLPECKGKGIGKLALKEIIKRVEKRGKSNLFL